jgi:hypothetical protein
MDSRLPLCFCGAVTLSPPYSERAAREISVLNVAKFETFAMLRIRDKPPGSYLQELRNNFLVKFSVTDPG